MQHKSLQFIFDATHHGKYDFHDFLHGDITESYTPIQIKQRTVYRPNKKLKAYLAFLNTFLFEYLEINERVVYSYRKGVNPHEVALAHAQSRAFFQTILRISSGALTGFDRIDNPFANKPRSDFRSQLPPRANPGFDHH